MTKDKEQFRPLKVLGAKKLIESGFYFDDEIVDCTDEIILSGGTKSSVKLVEELRQLSPPQFEHFVAEHFRRMKFNVTSTGPTSFKDGGIDLVAVPKIRNVGSVLIGVQAKHHHTNNKTGRGVVDRLLAWKDSHFRLVVLVTNMTFTRDARWVASQANNQPFIRLRDIVDIQRWMKGDYSSKPNWREIPKQVNLAPGVTVSVP